MSEQLSNLTHSTLQTAVDNSAVSLTLAGSSGFPSTGNFRVRVDNELMLVTARSGSVLTVTRGAEGTTPTNHASGSVVACVLTKASLLAAIQENATGGFSLPLDASDPEQVVNVPNSGFALGDTVGGSGGHLAELLFINSSGFLQSANHLTTDADTLYADRISVNDGATIIDSSGVTSTSVSANDTVSGTLVVGNELRLGDGTKFDIGLDGALSVSNGEGTDGQVLTSGGTGSAMTWEDASTFSGSFDDLTDKPSITTDENISADGTGTLTAQNVVGAVSLVASGNGGGDGFTLNNNGTLRVNDSLGADGQVLMSGGASNTAYWHDIPSQLPQALDTTDSPTFAAVSAEIIHNNFLYADDEHSFVQLQDSNVAIQAENQIALRAPDISLEGAVAINGSLSANGSNGTAGQVLTSQGAYPATWEDAIATEVNPNVPDFDNPQDNAPYSLVADVTTPYWQRADTALGIPIGYNLPAAGNYSLHTDGANNQSWVADSNSYNDLTDLPTIPTLPLDASDAGQIVFNVIADNGLLRLSAGAIGVNDLSGTTNILIGDGNNAVADSGFAFPLDASDADQINLPLPKSYISAGRWEIDVDATAAGKMDFCVGVNAAFISSTDADAVDRSSTFGDNLRSYLFFITGTDGSALFKITYTGSPVVTDYDAVLIRNNGLITSGLFSDHYTGHSFDCYFDTAADITPPSNPFDQPLNTTDSPTFVEANIQTLNVNSLFGVDSTGTLYLNNSAGTAGQVATTHGGGLAATWEDAANPFDQTLSMADSPTFADLTLTDGSGPKIIAASLEILNSDSIRLAKFEYDKLTMGPDAYIYCSSGSNATTVAPASVTTPAVITGTVAASGGIACFGVTPPSSQGYVDNLTDGSTGSASWSIVPVADTDQNDNNAALIAAIRQMQDILVAHGLAFVD